MERLQTAMEKYEKLSLRKIAEATGTNYNMLLKASKQPIPGVPYDPTAVNYEAVELYLSKKIGAGEVIPYEEIANTDINTITRLPFEPVAGMAIKLRNDDDVYQVIYVTVTHVVLLAVGGTQPRVFSYATLMHQGPKVVE